MNRQVFCAMALAGTLLALGGCSTDQVRGPFLFASAQPGPDRGGLMVAFAAPEDSYGAAEQGMVSADRTMYYVLVDGKVVSIDASSYPLTVFAGGNPSWAYYLDAGPHHFTVTAMPGQRPVFEGDGQIPGGGTAHLFLYGPLDNVSGVFVSVPSTPASGNEHITAVNLMRGGQAMEVVTCSDRTTCSPISGALALGDVFQTEVPVVVDDCDPASPASVPGSWSAGGCFTSITTQGAGVGYRLVATPSRPTPPINALTWGVDGLGVNSRPPIFVAAPVFMTDAGQSQVVLY
jgi:hypothetical protein